MVLRRKLAARATRRRRRWRCCASTSTLAVWTSTPTTSPAGYWTHPATRSVRRSPSRWTLQGSRHQRGTAGCGRRSPPSSAWPSASGCRSLTVEDLDFAGARQIGRETLGRGRRGRRLRRVVAGIPTRAFRELLVGMAANVELVGGGGGSCVDVAVGWALLAGALSTEQTKPTVTVSRASRGGGGDRQARPWAWCPAAARCAPSPPEDGQGRAAGQVGLTRSSAVRDPGLREASGQRRGRVRPAWLNGSGSGTRWYRTVWCHPSALTNADV